MLFTEPVPINENDPNAAFLYNNQLQELFRKANFLRLTQRSGAIQHGDKAGNLNAKWLVFTSNAVANTEDAVAHTLNRIPIGMLASVPDKAAILYASGTQWTKTTVYVKSSAAGVAWKAIIF